MLDGRRKAIEGGDPRLGMNAQPEGAAGCARRRPDADHANAPESASQRRRTHGRNKIPRRLRAGKGQNINLTPCQGPPHRGRERTAGRPSPVDGHFVHERPLPAESIDKNVETHVSARQEDAVAGADPSPEGPREPLGGWPFRDDVRSESPRAQGASRSGSDRGQPESPEHPHAAAERPDAIEEPVHAGRA